MYLATIYVGKMYELSVKQKRGLSGFQFAVAEQGCRLPVPKLDQEKGSAAQLADFIKTDRSGVTRCCRLLYPTLVWKILEATKPNPTLHISRDLLSCVSRVLS